MRRMAESGPEVTGGVDTHADIHAAAVVDSARGGLLGSATFPATQAGYEALHEWMKSYGRVGSVGVEGTGSYGAGLARFLAQKGIRVVEVDRPDRKSRRMRGKSDAIDAEAAARAVLSGRARGLPKSRDGVVEALRTLKIAYDSADKQRTQTVNQFHGMVVTAPESIRGRLAGKSTPKQLKQARELGARATGDDVYEATWFALLELARRVKVLDEQKAQLEERMRPLALRANPALMGRFGVDARTAIPLLVAAGDNPERLGSEAAFASMTGTAPIPASSGKTQRHRLNRGGDREANRALWRIVMVRMAHDPRTREYVARRTGEGKSKREIIRNLKRYVAREVFQDLMHPKLDLPDGSELRALRKQAGWSQGKLATAIGTTGIRLSRIERGLTLDTDLLMRARECLAATDAVSAAA